MLQYQERSVYSAYRYIAGVDEAGRGPWAGPVVAAAVILPTGYRNELINDSKKLTPHARETLFDVIQKDALAIGVALVDADTIDKINILQATKRAMRTALDSLAVKPDYVMLDAVTLPDLPMPQEGIVHGDALALPIAAASIIAKVTRDRLMIELHQSYPAYRFDLHKGYGTALHLRALRMHGPITGVHRLSYRPIKELLLSK